nr:class I SAM-dependent methyltransferase [Haladaptatus halobius]
MFVKTFSRYKILGVDANEQMLMVAKKKITHADVLRANFTEWSAADEGRVFDIAILMGGLLHLTDDHSLESVAENTHESLREEGAFVTFF